MAQIILNPTKDAYVTNNQPSTSFGTGVGLIVGRLPSDYDRSLLYFNLNNLAGKEIQSTILQMYKTGDVTNPSYTLDFSAHCINEDWVENTVTWNNQPSYTETAAVSLTQAAGDNDAWKNYDITTLVQDIIYNSRIYYGILLRQPGSTARTSKAWSSREGQNPPRLVVTYMGGFHVRVSGAWKDADSYVKVGGVWRLGQVFTRVSGTWRRGI